jgi:hypothetical protein
LVVPILAGQLFEWDGILSKMPCIYAVPLPIGRDLRGTTTTRENRAQVIKDSPRPDVFAADKAVGQNFAAGIDNDEIGDSAASVFLQ